MPRIKGTVWHYTAGSVSQTVQEIRDFHVNTRGWRDIGYNYIILHPKGRKKQDGEPAHESGHLIKIGRKIDDDLYLEGNEIGAHAKGSNSQFIGVSFVLPPGKDLHPLQKEAGRHLLRTLTERHKYPIDMNIMHKEVYATQCPGPFVEKWLDDEINLVSDSQNNEIISTDPQIESLNLIISECLNLKKVRMEELTNGT